MAEELVGAGSTCCAGGGGYSGGSGDSCVTIKHNGLCGDNYLDDTWLGGGGYYQGGVGIDTASLDRQSICLGGIFNQGNWGKRGRLTHNSGSGGIAGKGGTIAKSNNSLVFAFNGNLFTDSSLNPSHDYNDGLNQAPIYIQAGFSIEKYVYDETIYNDGSSDVEVARIFTLIKEKDFNNVPLTRI